MFLKGFNLITKKNTLVNVDFISAIIDADEEGITCLVNGGEVQIAREELMEQDSYWHELYHAALMHLTGCVATEPPIVEPDFLSEIADVTFELGRVCLTVKKGYERMSIKFGLSEKYQRYEFDGGTMYWYHSVGEKAAWSCSCGHGSHTLVSNDTSRCIREVKMEMSRQILSKDLMVPSNITSDLFLAVVKQELA